MSEPIQRVLLVSGGRTSGYMLRRELDKGLNGAIVIFCNTGKEMPQTLDFVHEMETQWNVPFVWLEYARVPATVEIANAMPTKRRRDNILKQVESGETTHWFRRVNYLTASRDGRPFDDLLYWMSVLPNVTSRGCSMQLKIRTAMRYAFASGLKEYSSVIGIRKDEEHRATQILSQCDTFEHPQFPLVNDGIAEKDVLRFWTNNSFDLQLKSYQGNCDLCFLKAKHKRVRMARENPELLRWWLDWEYRKCGCEGNGKWFRLGEPYTLIEELAKQPEEQEFCFVGDQDIPCSCAERGFEPDEP